MRRETIAIHGGYQVDPTTKAVAVPIYQTVAYAFDSAEHGAALFNLEAEGFRYSRIANPTNAVLERRVAALEGGLEDFDCTHVEIVRVRFSSPGYVEDDNVGLYVYFTGLPEGPKRLRIWWDYENDAVHFFDFRFPEEATEIEEVYEHR